MYIVCFYIFDLYIFGNALYLILGEQSIVTE